LKQTSALRFDRFAWIVLAVAFLLRVVLVLLFFRTEDALTDDGPFYILIAQNPSMLGIEGAVPYAEVSVGPVYPIFLMPFFHLIPDSMPVAQMVAARLAQALVDTVTVGLVYLLALSLFDRRVARVAMIAQALDARYLVQVGTIHTEPLFIMLFVAFMLLYTTAATGDDWKRYGVAGLLLGLSILERPVPLLFPVVLGLIIIVNRQNRREALKGYAWLVGITLLVIAPWIVRSSIVAGEFVPVASSGMSHFWRATREDGDVVDNPWTFNQILSEDLGAEVVDNPVTSSFVTAGLHNILAAPLQWIARVVQDTVASYLQPFGTVFLNPPTERGAKETVLSFLRGESSLAEVLAIPGLLRRSLMYIWHYWGLLGGLIGLVLAWRERWRRLLPLVGWVIYGTAVAAVLLVEPRYLFPLMFVFAVLAAYATVRLWDVLRRQDRPSAAGDGVSA
jgi:4-amino-4-deoxy-L-arabinose transferase-like glycosyltransferase